METQACLVAKPELLIIILTSGHCESPAYQGPKSTSTAESGGKERKQEIKRFNICLSTYLCTQTHVSYM